MTESTLSRESAKAGDATLMMAITASLVVLAIALAIMSRSWNGYFTMMGLALLGAMFSCSWAHWRRWLARESDDKQRHDDKAAHQSAQVHLLIIFGVIGAIGLFLIGLAERLVWANAESYPSVLFNEDYTAADAKKVFDVNEYRLFKEIVCKERGPVEIRDQGDGIYYLRCGMSFPESQVVRVKKMDFEAAAEESRNFKPGDPIVIHRGLEG